MLGTYWHLSTTCLAQQQPKNTYLGSVSGVFSRVLTIGRSYGLLRRNKYNLLLCPWLPRHKNEIIFLKNGDRRVTESIQSHSGRQLPLNSTESPPLLAPHCLCCAQMRNSYNYKYHLVCLLEQTHWNTDSDTLFSMQEEFQSSCAVILWMEQLSLLRRLSCSFPPQLNCYLTSGASFRE